ETLLTKEDSFRAAERLEKELANALGKMKASDEKEKLLEEVEYDIDRLKDGETFQDMYKYSAFFYDTPTSLLDYIPSDGLLILDEMGRIQEAAQNLDTEEADLYQTLLEQKAIIPHTAFAFEWKDVKAKMVQQRIHMSLFLRHRPGTQPQNIVNISSRAMQEFHGQMPLFKHELERWEKTDFSVLIVANDANRAEKVQSILEDYGMHIPIQTEYTLPLKQPIITIGRMHSGIELSMHKLAIITENEL